MTKSLFAVLATLLLVEAATRWALFPASGDFVRFSTYDALAQTLGDSSAIRIAVVGNSAAEEGIDSSLLAGELSRRRGKDVTVERFLADGSEIVTWDAMVSRYLWRAKSAPDVLVVSYVDSLADRTAFEYVRIGQFFTTPSQWGYYLSELLPDASTRIEFLLASTWATYGARDRLRDRALILLVPSYEAFLDRTYTPPKVSVTRSETPRYTALDRMLSGARARGVQVILVAFPLRSVRYEIEPGVLARIAANEVELLDLRSTPGLTPRLYRDEIHLLGEGREIFTSHLAAEIAPLLLPPTY